MAAKPLAGTLNWASTTPSLSTRSLFLTITPTPHSMPARLSILRAISAHGPVDHFRSLKHHPTAPQPNAFHTIVSSKEAAERLLKSSPFVVVEGGAVRTAYIDELGVGGEGEGAGYTVEVRHSYHAPEVAVRGSPLYGGWKSGLKNPISLALGERIPSGIAKEGLCDWSRDSPRERRAWFTGEGGADDAMPWRIAKRNREEEVRNGGVRRPGSGGMRRSAKPVQMEEDFGETEELLAQEAQEVADGETEGDEVLAGSRRAATSADPEMQRVFRAVADRFGPDADTMERSAQDAEAAQIEAAKIAAMRAASMERTRLRMGLSFTPPPSTPVEAIPATAVADAQLPKQDSPAVQQNVVLEDARRAMRAKKARYAAWIAEKTKEDARIKMKSKGEKWKMFWDEVESLRS